MRPFSDEWALAYRDAINASEGYRHSAANWELGPVALIARVDGDDQEDAAIYLDLERGECRYAMILSPKDAFRAANYVYEASYENWGRIFELSLNPVTAFLTGKLKLTKGSVYSLVNYNKSSEYMAQAAPWPSKSRH